MDYQHPWSHLLIKPLSPSIFINRAQINIPTNFLSEPITSPLPPLPTDFTLTIPTHLDRLLNCRIIKYNFKNSDYNSPSRVAAIVTNQMKLNNPNKYRNKKIYEVNTFTIPLIPTSTPTKSDLSLTPHIKFRHASRALYIPPHQRAHEAKAASLVGPSGSG